MPEEKERVIVTKKKMVLFPNNNVGMYDGYQLEANVKCTKADNMVVMLSVTDKHNPSIKHQMPFFCATLGKTANQFLDEVERLNNEVEYDPDSEQ
jgi:hypothetical protein